MNDKIKYFFPKVQNRLSSEKNRIWEYLPVEKISLWGMEFVPSKGKLIKRLQEILGEFTPEFFAGIDSQDKEIIIRCADEALNHDFNLLGSGLMHLDPIPWHSDFRSGYTWPKGVFYCRQKSGAVKGEDIKVPWELSRCQHLLWLGEAYLLTSDSRYAKEIVDEINWWIDDNPLMYSVNWTCSMDVAFRAVNWMFALNMIAKYDGFDDFFAEKVSKSLCQHGFFIRNNLEKNIPDSNNHYTSDLVGLLYIGALFDHTKKGRKWKRFAIKELRSETLNQVLPSGVHYERTVSYHRMMAEMLSYPVYMMKRIGEPVSEDVLQRIKGMYAYVSNYTKPNGLAPLIGDNDDGRFVPFLIRDFRDHNYLNDPNSLENRLISIGLEPLFCSSERVSKLYEDARVAMVHEGKNYLFVNCGGFSKRPKEEQERIGTHTHNDLLSFELALNGKDIIIDAGTYLYTSSKEDRDAFRSTAKHNTIMVDGEEQNGFAAPFVMTRNVSAGDLRQDGDTFFGEYTTLRGKMHHVRRFEMTKEGLTITDEITKAGDNHTANVFFHFAEGLMPDLRNGKVVVDGFATIEFSQSPSGLEVFEDTLSPSFGVLTNSKTAVANFNFDNEFKLTTTINKNGHKERL